MFIRVKKTPNSTKTAVQLVENVRTGKKISQKVVRHLGYGSTAEEIKSLRLIGEQWKRKEEGKDELPLFGSDNLPACSLVDKSTALQVEPMMVDLAEIREQSRIRRGFHDVYERIYREIGYDNIFGSSGRNRFMKAKLLNIVLARIARPLSKRGSVNLMETEYGIVMDLDRVYRMMDRIDAPFIDKICGRAYTFVTGLLGGALDVVFYDCTTLYFESFQEDGLKRNGYSKDGKFNQSQVLLALLVSENGLPVGYELFSGNFYEGNTLETAMQQLHDKYKIAKVVFVADAAMLNKDNLVHLHKYDQSFIVGARIKTTSAQMAAKITDRTGYAPLNPSEPENENAIAYRELITEEGNRLIVTYSPVRAAKDKHDRDKAIEQLTKRLHKSKKPKSLLNNYGYKKFIAIEGDAKISIDQTKINEAAKWDGLHGITTNIKEMPVHSLLKHYSGLWQVEQTFRISKSDLAFRPVFHWNPQRIQAHIAICFMALVCVRALEHKVALQYKKLSPEAIRNILSGVQLSILVHQKTGVKYGLPSSMTQDAKKIYQLMGLRLRETPFIIK